MLARSATAKRLGIDGMAALRFHIRKQTRPRRRRRRQERKCAYPVFTHG
jgi:hypothetical protein